VGVGGFFGEETAKLGRGNGRGWRDGIRVEDEFLVMAGSLFPIDRIYQQAVIIRKNPAEKIGESLLSGNLADGIGQGIE
jgi:hypothetical protein